MSESNGTSLTIAGLKELVFARLSAIENIQDGMHADLDKRLTGQCAEEFAVFEKLFSSRLEVINEKFTGVILRFDERDARNNQATMEAREAVHAALANSDRSMIAQMGVISERFETFNEKFRSVAQQFKERDERSEQRYRDNKLMLDAEFESAEKSATKQNETSALSIAKSEGATNKQIDQLGELIRSTSSANNDKLDDMKERLLRLEGGQLGRGVAQGEQVQSRMSTVSIISLVVGSLIGLTSLIASLIFRAGIH